MAGSLYKELTKAVQQRMDSGILWVNVPAIVVENEDPEHRHRIKVVIPRMNEEGKKEVHDEWIDFSGPYAGSAGHGDVAIPAIGSEVLLTGEMGQGERLFYLCTYNENSVTPGDSDDETVRVIRAPGDLIIACRGDLKLEGGRILMKSRFGTIQESAAAGKINDPEDEGGGG